MQPSHGPATADSTATHGIRATNLPDSAHLAPNGRGFDSRARPEIPEHKKGEPHL